MNTENTENMTLTHSSGYSRIVGKLPAASVLALLDRGFSHVLGNEVSSKIVARIKAALSVNDAKDAPPPTREAIRSFREAHADLVAEWTRDAAESALAAIDAGTLGVKKESTPRTAARTPLDVEMAAEALRRVLQIGIDRGVKIPVGAKVLTLGGQEYTRAQLVQRQLDRDFDGIQAIALKVLKERAKRGLAPDADF